MAKKLAEHRKAFAAMIMAVVLTLILPVQPAVYADDDTQTVYDISDFIEWMLERDDLTDEMTADLDNAQEMLEGYVESGEILLDDETDGIALSNLQKAIAILQTIDELRQSDDNYNGSIYTDTPTLYTNFTFMVGSAYTANVSATSYSHVSSYTTFSYNENLAWGYTDPTAGWYTEEKELFDECRDELGYTAPITSSQLAEIKTLASEKDYTIGHYTNLFYNVNQVMGVGYCTYTNSYSNRTASSNASSLSINTSNGYAAYTIDEFEEYFYEFYTSVMGTEGECGDSAEWAFDLTSGILTISGSGSMTDYEAGTAPWYYLGEKITSVEIGSDVTDVSAYAFYGLTGIKNVSLSGAEVSIGDYAFYGCTGIEELNISGNLTTIGSYSFYKCTSLTEAALGEGLTSLGSRAFGYCTGLTDITLPETVVSIGTYAFYGCSALTSVTVSGNITSENVYPFYGCSALTKVTFSDGVTSVPAYLFGNCTGLKTIEFSDTVTSIGMYAFYGSGIEELTIPETITYLDGCAFAACKSLTSVSIVSESLSASTAIFQNCTSLTDISLPDSMTSISGYMFSGCTSLEGIEIPANVTSIGSRAFYGCTSLTDITIPEKVTSIGSYAFYNCTALTEAVMSGGVKTINTYAFYGCTALENVTFPSTLKTIYTYAFDGCTSLTDVYYVGSASTWSSNVTIKDGNDVFDSVTFHYIISIADTTVTLSASNYTYDGTAKEPEVTVTYDGDTLTEGTDYTVSYADNTDAGTASVTVTGAGDCISSKTVTFTIDPASISDAAVTLSENTFTYDGSAKTPAVTVILDDITLSADTDYTVSYADNTDAGTAAVTVTGTGNYTDAASASFTIDPVSIDSASVTLDYTTVTYSGLANEPAAVVTLDGTALVSGTDYTTSYSGNTAAGTATVTVTGIGNYTGSASSAFTISPASIANAAVSFSSDSYTYSGSAIEPAAAVTLNGTTLEEGTDYTVSCENNTDVGTASMTITGCGNYTDSVSTTFTIVQASVASASVALSDTEVTYSGSAIEPAVTVAMNGTVLSAGTDYTVTYSDNTDAGTASVTITGTGNYTGTIAASFTISPASVSEASFTLSEDSFTYSGLANEPETVVILDGNTLTAGTDYTVSYADNTDAGTATVTITGIGNYTGTKSAAFTIDQVSLSDASLSLSQTAYTYDGTAKEPSVTVTLDGSALTEGTDYTVEYSDNTNAGTATVTIVGTGNYMSTASQTFVISAASIASAEAVFEADVYSYTGAALKPVPSVTLNGVILTAGSDYTVSYENNTNIGTASATITGTGNYTGSITASFAIKASIADAEIVFTDSGSLTYDGTEKKPSVTVTLDGDTLTENTDYTVSYSDNINAGTATVTITGTGNYTGTASAEFTINKKSISSATVTLSKTSYTYSGSVNKPSVSSVVLSGTTLAAGTDYSKTYTYSNNTNAGTATVKVTGTGNYTGTASATFTINKKSISSAAVTLSKTSYTYSGSANKPGVSSVVLSGTTLTAGTDYSKTYTYSNNTNAGTATVKVTGTGNYTGTASATFTINKKSISSAAVTLSKTSYTYSGSPNKPSVSSVVLSGTTLTAGTDYSKTYSYSKNTAIGTATVKVTGTGNYTGTATATFTIKPGKVTISSVTSSAAKKLTVKWTKLSGNVKYRIAYKKSGSSTWTYKTVSASTVSKTLSSLTALKKYTVKVQAYKVVNNVEYKGSWSSTKSATVKKAQTLTVKTSTKTVSYSKVKKAKQTVKAITKVSGAKGTVTYAKSSGKSYFTVNKSTGKITVKKGTPKGTYTVKITVTSAAKGNYAKTSKTVTVKIKVK